MSRSLLHRLSELPPHIAFLVIAGINCILLTVLTPPFQVHDESQHFLRAYQLSEGNIWSVYKGGYGGSVLPSSLQDFIRTTWGAVAFFEVPPLRDHPLAETFGELARPLAPGQRAFADFTGAANYSPLPYIPQALGIAIGRVFEAPPLVLLYAGRLLNAACAIAIIAWALSVLPAGRVFALVIALLPMAQYEYASVAPDAAIIATAFLFTAIALRANARNAWTAKDVWILAIAGVGFCSIKPVYAPLLLTGFTVRRYATERSPIHHLVAYLIVVSFALAVTMAWLISSPQGAGALAGPQLAYIIQNPFEFALTLVRDLMSHGGFYIIDGIGILGAFTVYLPVYAYGIAIGCVVLSCIYPRFDRTMFSLRTVLWNWLLIASGVVLIQTALYLLFTRVGYPLVAGVQGRYFLPLGALMAATVVSSIWARYTPPERPIIYPVVVILIALNTMVLDVTIIREFGLL